MNRLIVLTAGNSIIGFGHIVRCQALVSQLRNINATFYSTEDLSAIIQNEANQNLSFQQLNRFDDILPLISENDIVLIDHYEISNNLIISLKSRASGIIFIDDIAERFFYADLILNPTPGFDIFKYRGLLDTQFLIGIEYALLRQPFQELAKQTKQVNDKNIMICFGGSDPNNLTEKALINVLEFNFFDEINVVMGSGYQHFERLSEAFISDSIHFYKNLNAQEMAVLMSSNAYAIYPCSGILLEGLAAKQKIVSGYYIDNQKYVYQLHKKLGSFFDAISFGKSDLQHAIEQMITNKQTNSSNHLIDGKSIQRIQKHIDVLFEMQKFNIRNAIQEDVEVTFSWANDPETRKFSFSKDKILWDSHFNWFMNKINSENCIYLILEKDTHPIGSIRFDLKDGDALISYLIAPLNHGKGYGTILLKKGLQYIENLQGHSKFKTVTGIVQEENIASIKTFERFGFEEVKENGNFVFTKHFIKDDENWKS